MSDIAFVALVLYGIVLILGYAVVGTAYAETPQHYAEDRKEQAQALLLMPVWPLGALYLLLRYGVPSVMHWLGRLFVDATRELEDSND